MAKQKAPALTKAPAKNEEKVQKKTSVKEPETVSAKTTSKAVPEAAPKPGVKSSEPAPAEEKVKKEVKDVHTLSFVAGKGWAVKRQGSDKVIKYFKTKFEATEYIVQVSGNQKTSVVIRLKNGKFQKFDNAMKALSYAKSAKEDE